MTSLKQNHTNNLAGNSRKYEEIDHIRVKEAVDKATAEGTRTVDMLRELLTEWEGPPTTSEGLRYLIKMWQRWPWGIKEFMDMETQRIKWTPKEDNVLIDWHQRKPAMASAELIKELVLLLNKATPKAQRTYRAITDRVYSLNLGKPQNTGFVFEHDNLAKAGLKVEDGYEVKNSRGHVPLECIAQGHKFKRPYREASRSEVNGCIYCNHTIRFVDEKYFEENPEAKDLPHNIYFIFFPNFKIPSVKIGIARNLIRRYSSYPEYEVIFEKQMSYYDAYTLEKLIKNEFELYITNPEELKNPSNGHSECFDPSVESKILKILNEHESRSI